MSAVVQDIRYAVRSLSRAKLFTTIAVLTLALGIGATTTLFGAVSAVLLRPPAYRDPHRLVALGTVNRSAASTKTGVSPGAFVEWREISRSLDAIAAYRPWGYVLGDAAGPERVRGARVSVNLFTTLGVEPLLGRTFMPDDSVRGREHVALVSEELWRSRYADDPSLVGRPIRLDGEQYEVVGIVPRRFALPDASVWVPLVFAPYELDQRGSRALSVVARLRAGVTIGAARADLERVSRVLVERHPESEAGWLPTVVSLHDHIVGDRQTPLVLLFAATALVLVIACANLATLLLARATTRRREVAMRSILGAGRLRVLRHIASETAVIVATGSVLGIGLASAGTRALASLGPTLLPAGSDVRVDALVVAFAIAVSVVCGVALSAVPARDAARLDLNQAIKSGAPGPRARGSRVEARDVLVVGQIALSLLLMVGAGLLVRSFVRAAGVDLGFSPTNVLSTTVSLPSSRYADDEHRALFFRALTDRVRVHSGVRAVSLASHIPLGTAPLMTDFAVAGAGSSVKGESPRAQLVAASGDYFASVGIRLVRGRVFGDEDRLGAPPIVVIDETLAGRYFPGEDPIGKRVRVGTTLGADTSWREIVGVVRGVRAVRIVEPPEPMIYAPYAQNPWPTMAVLVRTDRDPIAFSALVRAEILALDRELPAYNVRTLDDAVATAMASRRFETVLLAAFASTAVLLAVLGVYGVMAHAVAQRTRELGIRIAIGAQRRDVFTLVLRRAMFRMLVGTGGGVLAAAATSRVLGSLLFGVSPLDAVSFGGATVILLIAGAVATYLPARQATRVDPVIAFRRE
jgi:putative ABC transport system permease protein